MIRAQERYTFLSAALHDLSSLLYDGAVGLHGDCSCYWQRTVEIALHSF